MSLPLPDRLRLYYTGDPAATANYPSRSGGIRSMQEVGPTRAFISTPIPALIVQYMGAANTPGTAWLRGLPDNRVQYQAPNDEYGEPVPIQPGETVWAVSANNLASVRVTWDPKFADFDIDGEAMLTLSRMVDSGFNDANDTPDQYVAYMVVNHDDQPIAPVEIWCEQMSDDYVTGVQQLGATGYGTIETSTPIAHDVPRQAFWGIYQNDGTLREIVLANRVLGSDTQLSVPSANHRALSTTTASAGAANDIIRVVPNIRIGIETPDDDGAIQTIASTFTPPSGVTFSLALREDDAVEIANIGANRQHGIWIEIFWADVGNDGFFWGVFPFNVRIKAAGQVTRYGGKDLVKRTDFDEAFLAYHYGSADSESMPPQWPASTFEPAPDNVNLTGNFSLALKDNQRNYVLIRRRNAFGFDSLNQEFLKLDIDSGADETSPLVEPDNIELLELSGGLARITARYPREADAEPADTWLLFVTTDGTDPDPDVDTPQEIVMTLFGRTNGPNDILSETLGPYSIGTDLRVVVQVRRTDPGVLSIPSPVQNITIASPPLQRASHEDAFLAHAGYISLLEPRVFEQLVVGDVTLEFRPAETLFVIDGSTAFRFTWPDQEFSMMAFPNDWILKNDTAFGAPGVANGIEVVSSSLVYLVRNNTRVVEIDATAKSIAAERFEQPPLEEITNLAQPQYANSQLSVYDTEYGTWRAVEETVADGTWRLATRLKQRIG